MEKSAFTREYQVLCRLLQQVRAEAGMTQVQLAEKLDETQSEVSKFERGERRLDLVQLRHWCRELGITLPQIAKRFEDHLGRGR
jgi:transcriptional regulator with XRE-family HTH domain